MELGNLNLVDFLPKYLLMLIAAAYVLGAILKSINIVKDKYITLILGVLCITMAILLIIINGQYKVMLDAIVNGILYGIISWGVAIGINQTVKQISKKDE